MSVSISGEGSVTGIDQGLNVVGVVTASQVNVGSAVTIHTGGFQVGFTSIHSTGTIVAAGSTSAPSITPTGDSNTGIFFPSADTIAFAEGGVEALRIKNNGYVGIGTDNPGYDLHVGGRTNSSSSTITLHSTNSNGYGTFQFYNNIGNVAYLWQNGSGQSAYGGANSLNLANYYGTISFAADSSGSWTERMKIDTSGRVTTPYQPMFSAATFSSNGSTLQTNVVAWRWATIYLDVGSNFNNTTGVYTCPVAGKYLINFNFNRRASPDNWTGLYILKNNATIANSWFPPGPTANYSYAPTTANVVIDCAASDTLAFCYHNLYSAPSTANDGNFGSIILIG